MIKATQYLSRTIKHSAIALACLMLLPSVAHARSCAGLGDAYYDAANGKCYYAETTAPLTHTNAQTACVANGGNLVTINDAAEQTLIATNFPAGGTIFINGSDASTEGTWRWGAGDLSNLTFWSGNQSGTPQNSLYNNWQAGTQPSNSAGNLDCAAIITGSAHVWQSVTCVARNYLCELSACSSPLGDPGQLIFNEDARMMQYCNGSTWVPMAQVYYTPPAIYFDGAAYLSKTTDLTGHSSSNMVTGSFWFKTAANAASQVIMQTVSGSFQIYLTTTGRVVWDGYLDNTPIPAEQVLYLYTNAGGFNDGEWHHVMYSMDLSNGANRHVYVDGVSQAITVDTYSNTPIDFTDAGGYRVAANGTAFFLTGALADVWFETALYMDLSVAGNRAKFYSTATNRPVDLGDDGSGPTGSAPDVYLSGSPASWHVNKGTGGGFTIGGALSSATGPTAINGNGVNSGLLAYWPLDDGMGITANNTMGGSNGTLTNMAASPWVAGQIGGALDLDGTNDYVNIPVIAPYRITDDLTLSAWINADSTTGLRRIVTMPRDSTGGAENYSLTLNAGQLQFWTGGGWPDLYVETPLAVTGTWRHVAGTVIGTTMYLYLDGVQVASGPAGDRAISTAGSMAIGRFNNDFPQHFNGRIDDVRLYDRGLSAAEVSELYQWGLSGGLDCDNPARKKGTIIYNADSNVPQFCDGENWRALGPVPGPGGAGCIDPIRTEGAIIFNSASKVMQYCDGAAWKSMPGMAEGPPTAGLIHHWPLDEAAVAVTVADAVGGADCTVVNNGGTRNSVAGRLGTALQYEDSYLDCGTINALYSASSFTMSGWFKRNTSGSLVSIGHSNEAENMLSLSLWEDGQAFFVLTAPPDDGTDEAEFAMPGTGWHHLTMVYDGTLIGNANRLKGYINGNPVTLSFYASSVEAMTATLADAEPFLMFRNFGALYDGAGTLDDIRIYNRPLTAPEVAQLYRATGGD